MRSISFFRQKRRDGGIRTGIDIGSETVLCNFEAGSEDSDPALLWYVDVSAEGPGVPSSPDAAREWLAGHGAAVRAALIDLASELPAGMDPDYMPVQRTVALQGTGRRKTKLLISVAFLGRAEAARLPRVLREIADHWDDHVGTLVAA